MDELEDQHLQIDLDDIEELLDYDIIVRTDGDDLTKYTGFELYNYKLGKSYGWVSFSDGSFHPQENSNDCD